MWGDWGMQGDPRQTRRGMVGWELQTGSPTAGRLAGCPDCVSLHLQPARLSVICDRYETGLCIRRWQAEYGLDDVCLAVMLGMICAEAARSQTATVHVIDGLCLGVQIHKWCPKS